MRTGTTITRGLSTLAITALAVAAAISPVGADTPDEAPISVIVSQANGAGDAPTFKVVETDPAGLRTLMADPDVSISADGSHYIQWRPDDPDYLDQWEHHVTGIETAWDTTRGSEDIVIAVLDSGVEPGPEFGDRLLAGASFIDGDPHSDPLGHGTAVASVVAAGADNGVGGVGACPNCTILPVQVADSSGSVPWSAAANGVVWAVDQGADILNLSFGSQIESKVLGDAVEYALSRGVVVIAAAGNYGTENRVYPANLDGVISVAGHDQDYERYGWSSHGQWVDIAGPGCARGVYEGEISLVCGTSFAAPWVAGATALAIDELGSLDNPAAEALLEGTSAELDYVETGRIDASILVGGGHANLVQFRDKVSARAVDLDGEYRGDVVQVDLIVDGDVADTSDTDDGTFQLTWNASEAEPGTYRLQVDAHDSDGNTNRSGSVTIEVIAGTGFGDVTPGAFYERGVEWMVVEGITNGTSPSTFSPDAPVTRGQLATFLYRYAGQPAVDGSAGFADVADGAYYADPVAWMVSEGITRGTSPTTFSPDDGVTRGQLAAFLHRFAGSPDAAAEAGFEDVARSAYYAVPVDFMLERGITTGTSPTTFSPDSPVTRGQLATFLWRLAGEPII